MNGNHLLRCMAGLCMVFALGATVRAAWSSESGIVDANGLDQAISRGAIVWDARDTAEYAEGHIPGAISIGDVLEVLRDRSREELLPTALIEQILGLSGIDPTREIVIYGNAADPRPYYAHLVVRYFGGSRSKVYHGGLDDWKWRGRTAVTAPRSLRPLALSLSVNPGVTLNTPELRARLDQANIQILDVRTAAEYTGQDIRAIRGGHVPGASNILFEQNWQDPLAAKKLADGMVPDREGMRLKDRGQLIGVYAHLDPTKETIVYCQSGARAAQTSAVLRMLGFHDVKVYEPSWLAYGSTLDAPAEDVAFLNVGSLLGELNKLRARVDQLEKQVGARPAESGSL